MAPMWSLILPSLREMMIGRPCPSQIAFNLEFKPPFVAQDAGEHPLFSRLQAVRWALRWVTTNIKVSEVPPLIDNALNISVKTLNLLHRMRRLKAKLNSSEVFEKTMPLITRNDGVGSL